MFLSSVLTGTRCSLADEFEEAQIVINNDNFRVVVVDLEKALASKKVDFLGRI